LRPPDAPALARLLEHSARLAGRNDRLALWFTAVADVLQEADRLAEKAQRSTIKVKDVDDALEQRRRRHDLIERRTQEALDDGLTLLETAGSRVGVINALVVHDTPDQAFARPTRVTVTVSLGREGLVDIERKAELSGESHHKGVQIISGLLRERYAQDKPLALTASICFEQSYAHVDGDSASMGELVAVISALADAPIAQNWAMTGSINQKGEIQPVGDVNAKIEGFYDACLARGLTGKQGVLIPEANTGDLMLRDDVVKAVTKGRFHVAAVKQLDDALELLTGVPAGARPGLGESYAEGSLNRRADARLTHYAEAARRYRRG
ncbi:AAA family ATPase, partial [Planctomycetota bacterium]|nr:AAA family ATPase [Planctomycetota bacterium]